MSQNIGGSIRTHSSADLLAYFFFIFRNVSNNLLALYDLICDESAVKSQPTSVSLA